MLLKKGRKTANIVNNFRINLIKEWQGKNFKMTIQGSCVTFNK